jgi:hypothetical protein
MKPLDFCEEIKVGSRNPLVDFAIKWIFKTVPRCPIRNNNFQLNNLSFSPEQAKGWPEGVYRGYALFKDQLDEKIFAIQYDAHIRNTDDIVEFK